jgi:hypothetical protein
MIQCAHANVRIHHVEAIAGKMVRLLTWCGKDCLNIVHQVDFLFQPTKRQQ